MLELGRARVEIEIITVENAWDEKVLDLPLAARGFRVRDRDASSVLRISNIKGEVAKQVSADPPPKYWTIPAGEQYEGFLGMRVAVEDAVHPLTNNPLALEDVKDGTVLEQRYYVTSESDDTTIEVVIFPGF